MKLYIKQKVFSWGDKFFVKDEAENDRYVVEGEVFSWGKKLHIYDVRGNEVAFIRQKLFTFLPRYYIEINNAVVCEIVKEFTFFRHKYHLEGLNWHLDGDYFAHDYSLTCGNFTIMQMNKKWMTWGDSYELDIANPADELMCLCVALAVDCAMAASNSR